MGAAQQNYLNKIFKLKETVAGFDFNLTAARDGCTFNSSYSQDNGGWVKKKRNENHLLPVAAVVVAPRRLWLFAYYFLIYQAKGKTKIVGHDQTQPAELKQHSASRYSFVFVFFSSSILHR